MTFRWPFVHRAQLDATLTLVDHYQGQAAFWRNLYEGVVTRATPVPTPPVVQPKREPDEADTAIDFVAQGDAQRRRYLERYAKAQRRAGVEPAAIAAAILRGDREEDE